MGRSMLLVIAYLGCLKAGLAVMPIERSLPQDRVRFMIKDSRCKLVLSASSFPLPTEVRYMDILAHPEIHEKTSISKLSAISSSHFAHICVMSCTQVDRQARLRVS